ncbi:response regulator [Dyadobacter sp. NIV53]|uniref:response regulator n=1 Tax=Dyadobacter sp. NIV53 TaxID=2861765 RepID=UPI001C88CCEA|nr:response regulator [Dyadobacter sp. NIV53]
MRIVIIEDETDLGILMRNFLVKQFNIDAPGSIVKLVTSLTEGINCIKQIDPDWVFMDNNLPDGKGINEIKSIKSYAKNENHTRIVMMSAMTNLREEAIKNGADFFLDKPISFAEVQNIFDSPMV